MKNSKDTIYISSVIIVLLFAWIFIWPNVQNIEELNVQINKEQRDVEVLKETQTSILKARTFFSGLGDETRELVNLAAPEFPDKANLINILNNLAFQNGLIVNSIKAEEEQVSKKKANISVLASMPTVMVLEGKYISLKEFIGSLEKSLRIFEVDNIDIQTKPGADLDVFTLTGRAYYTR